MMSDESENDGVYTESYENDSYYKKYKLLLERCEAMQKYNEKLVFRIQQVNKITKRRCKDVTYMSERLSSLHGEYWAAIPKNALDVIKTDDEQENTKPPPPPPPVKIKEEKSDELCIDERPRPTKKPTKRKSNRSDRDPNAPKRPSNPFFQFCQEQRQIMMEQLNAELKPGEAEPSKQELTRQLAIKWKSLSTPDKKIYVDMYERSKEKYAAEMSEYMKK